MELQINNFRDYHRYEIEEIRRKRSELGLTSHVGKALTEELFAEIKERVESSPEEELEYGRWPWIWGFAAGHSAEVLAALDNDIELVLSRTCNLLKSSVTSFLRSRDRRSGVFYGALFELACKATMLRHRTGIQFDIELANGRDHDVAAEISKRILNFECTVLTEDDESREVWDRFLESKRLDPDQILIRPGPFCPTNAKGPSPYYNAIRVYGKIYDKLSRNLDPTLGQFPSNKPNVLLLSMAGPGVFARQPGVSWAIEEIFACHPRSARTVVPEHLTDISLDAWVDHRACQLIDRSEMTSEWYCENSNRILQAPQLLGAILLFDGTSLISGRINYNAREECALKHSEIAALEDIFASPAPYLKR